MKIVFCVLFYCTWWSIPVISIKRKIGLGEINELDNAYAPIERWYRQKVDHFNPTDKRTWLQRYQMTWDNFKRGGPIFIMLGGEGAISSSWMKSGTWIDYAKELNALCFQLEHRYYGQSQPFTNLSTDNLVYLTTEQSLADIAEFISYAKRVYDPSSNAKVVTFGGSYAGSLSAWMRMKYPHIVHTAVSSSGPLLAKLNFREYYEVVEKSLGTYSPECVVQIRRANQMLNSLLNRGQKTIEDKFKLCEPFNNTKKRDVATLFESLASEFAGVVQYNKDNRKYENSKRKFINIDTVCDIMVNESIPTSLDRYAEVNKLLLETYGEKCLNINYTSIISYYLSTSLDGASFGGRQWMYQTCTEFGFYQTSDQRNHIFGSHFPLQYFIDMCTDIFGESITSNLRNGISRTNLVLGGLDLKESRVIYVNGNIDPWHALSINETKLKNTKAILINGTAHCSDMYPPSTLDSSQLIDARETIKQHLKQWLTEDDFV